MVSKRFAGIQTSHELQQLPSDTVCGALQLLSPNASQAKGACLPNSEERMKRIPERSQAMEQSKKTDQFRLCFQQWRTAASVLWTNRAVRYSNCHSVRNSVAVAGR
jgi:hypothetical protein